MDISLVALYFDTSYYCPSDKDPRLQKGVDGSPPLTDCFFRLAKTLDSATKFVGSSFALILAEKNTILSSVGVGKASLDLATGRLYIIKAISFIINKTSHQTVA